MKTVTLTYTDRIKIRVPDGVGEEWINERWYELFSETSELADDGLIEIVDGLGVREIHWE